MSVPNTGGLHVDRNLATSDFCGLEKQGGLYILYFFNRSSYRSRKRNLYTCFCKFNMSNIFLFVLDSNIWMSLSGFISLK